jgi:hypothetical protein
VVIGDDREVEFRPGREGAPPFFQGSGGLPKQRLGLGILLVLMIRTGPGIRGMAPDQGCQPAVRSLRCPFDRSHLRPQHGIAQGIRDGPGDGERPGAFLPFPCGPGHGPVAEELIP